jgi:hypothetical protein
MNTCATCRDDSCPEQGRDCNGCEDWTNEEAAPEPNPDQLGILDEYEARLVARYKWQRDQAIRDEATDIDDVELWVEMEVARLDRRWEDHLGRK